MLNIAGKKIAVEQFKTQGLRVVSVCFGESSPSLFKKWRDSGKTYPMYTNTNNCLEGFFKHSGVPHAYCIKQGKAIDHKGLILTFDYVKYIKEVFGLK